MPRCHHYVIELREFLGLTGYYRKFVCNYEIIAAPLTQLLQKGQIHWDDKAQKTFEELKIAMITTPVLIKTNALDTGIRAVLSQQG